jgi:hypothetical protein
VFVDNRHLKIFGKSLEPSIFFGSQSAHTILVDQVGARVSLLFDVIEHTNWFAAIYNEVVFILGSQETIYIFIRADEMITIAGLAK